MNDILSDLNSATNSMVDVYFKLCNVGRIRNLNDFIMTMETIIKRISFTLTDDLADKMSSIFQLDDEKTNHLKETHWEARAHSIKNAKVIMDFISKSDTNKKFFSGYIEHVIGYFDFNDNKIINNHPFLSTQSMYGLLSKPYFSDDDGVYYAMHYFMTTEDNKPTPLFGIGFLLDTFGDKKQGEIINDLSTAIEFSKIISPKEQEEIRLMIENITAHPNTEARLVHESIFITHQINENYFLNIYFPKNNFKLK